MIPTIDAGGHCYELVFDFGEHNENHPTPDEDSILAELNNLSNQNGLIRIISLKHEFHNEWYQASVSGGNLRIVVEKQHFPYFISGFDVVLQSVELKSYDNENLSQVGSLTSNNEIPLEADISLDSPDFEKEVYIILAYTLQAV